MSVRGSASLAADLFRGHVAPGGAHDDAGSGVGTGAREGVVLVGAEDCASLASPKSRIFDAHPLVVKMFSGAGSRWTADFFVSGGEAPGQSARRTRLFFAAEERAAVEDGAEAFAFEIFGGRGRGEAVGNSPTSRTARILG